MLVSISKFVFGKLITRIYFTLSYQQIPLVFIGVITIHSSINLSDCYKPIITPFIVWNRIKSWICRSQMQERFIWSRLTIPMCVLVSSIVVFPVSHVLKEEFVMTVLLTIVLSTGVWFACYVIFKVICKISHVHVTLGVLYMILMINKCFLYQVLLFGIQELAIGPVSTLLSSMVCFSRIYSCTIFYADFVQL